jgi:ribosomal-protein-serine acetyltransferase
MFSYRVDDEIELRLLEERHAETLFALVDANRAYLREWLPWLDENRDAEASRAFIRSCLQQFADNKGYQAGVWVEGELAGMLGHHAIDRANRTAMIGYWLAAGYQGRGIMTRACRALVDQAFDELGMNRVVIRCGTGNARSCAIPRRLGFTLEGVMRQSEWLYDHFVDHNVYAMLAEDWAALHT